MKTVTIDGEEYVRKSDVEALKPAEKVGRWKPEFEEYYWYAGVGAPRTHWDNDPFDNWVYSQGNCFQTKEEAEKYKEYLEAKATIRNANEFVPDWADDSTRKYFAIYDHSVNELMFEWQCQFQFGVITYYESKEAANQAIKDFDKEYLLVFAWERGEL